MFSSWLFLGFFRLIFFFYTLLSTNLFDITVFFLRNQAKNASIYPYMAISVTAFFHNYCHFFLMMSRGDLAESKVIDRVRNNRNKLHQILAPYFSQKRDLLRKRLLTDPTIYIEVPIIHPNIC